MLVHIYCPNTKSQHKPRAVHSAYPTLDLLQLTFFMVLSSPLFSQAVCVDSGGMSLHAALPLQECSAKEGKELTCKRERGRQGLKGEKRRMGQRKD